MAPVLWRPAKGEDLSLQINRFREGVNSHYGEKLEDVHALHGWSCVHREKFWRYLWNDYGVGRPYGEDEPVIEEGEGRRPSDVLMTTRFFPHETLNGAEVMLRGIEARKEALVFHGEGGVVKRLSGEEVLARVACLASYLEERGVSVGDRVVAYMPNLPETVIGFLAAASLGAVWSSCSPDFGVEATVSRLGQVEPKVLLCADGYRYGGKTFDGYEKIRLLCERLSTLEEVIVTGFLKEEVEEGKLGGLGLRVSSFQSCCEGQKTRPDYAQLPFDHPLLIAFSSGTTGVPKCIVHRAGGLVLNWIKEHRLHCDIKEGDRVFYFTTCGWMMWNWLVGSLASGATLILYDGHPLPRGREGYLFSLAEEEGMTFFGTSARYLQTLEQCGYQTSFDLSLLRTLTSTGSPLAPSVFRYVYRHLKSDIHLASISGGTDIMGCFLLGSPSLEVREGQLQMAGLGMDVAVYDEGGKRVKNKCGELVSCVAFPNQPLGFWRDSGGERCYKTYYAQFPGVWYHGDFLTEVEGEGFVIHGRSDTTLNPGGVRIGSAEIREPVERMEEVREAVAVGKAHEGDVAIVLFVILEEGKELDDDFRKAIVACIRREASPRHVPKVIAQVNDFPRTLSGKVSEMAITHLINGRDVSNREALANPDSLENFRDHPSLFEM